MQKARIKLASPDINKINETDGVFCLSSLLHTDHKTKLSLGFQHAFFMSSVLHIP